jgi:hypothetical protein
MTITIDPLIANKLKANEFRSLYAKLETYYDGNGVYDAPSQAAFDAGKWLEALKPLRNVAPRSVEFYAVKMLSGPVQIITKTEGDTDPLKDALEQVITWSNFNEKKQLYQRDMAKLGDLYWKVQYGYDESVKPPKEPVITKVFIEQVQAENVVDFKEDPRGYLLNIRIETLIPDGKGGKKNRIEFCDKEADIPYYAAWETNQEWPIPLDELGDAVDYVPLAQWGINFVNYVHVKFKDTGAMRGQGCFTHALDKIDEANRQATRLAQMVFKKASGTNWIKTTAFDKDNRPLASPPVADATGKPITALTVTDDTWLRLPAGSSVESTIPSIAWEAIRNIANDMVEELKEDMPELRYYDQVMGANQSGLAISYILMPALDRAREAGTNFATGLERALKMALTMGQFAKVLQVTGSYEAGNFDHTIAISAVIEPSNDEKARTLDILVKAKVPKYVAMKIAGFSDKIIQQTKDEDGAATNEKKKTALEIIEASRAK